MFVHFISVNVARVNIVNTVTAHLVNLIYGNFIATNDSRIAVVGIAVVCV